MNINKVAVRSQVPRRFSRSDGVIVATGVHKGRPAYVQSCSVMEVFDKAKEPFEYLIEFTDTAGGMAFIAGDDLNSDPPGNRGKYGGPSRGGASGGWMGISGYRRR